VHQSNGNKEVDSKVSASHSKPSHNANDFVMDSGDSINHLQRTVGNQVVQKLARSSSRGAEFDFARIEVQPKLKVSQPNDPYEQEADRVAGQVIRMQTANLSTPRSNKTAETIGRKCEACEMKKEEEKKNLMISRKSISISDFQATDETANEISNMRSSGGSPLETPIRTFMESRFGVDFSEVRIHTDRSAKRSANSVNALAYTAGNHIAFAEGQYQPETSEGRILLAHELVHTIQQAGSHQGALIQRMQSCPTAFGKDDPVPAGWKAYHGNSCWFHCCYRGILEDRPPSPDDPQNECFYDNNGSLVDEGHEHAGCRGTPNEYDSATDWWNHTFNDRGGIWAKGWGAFWSSRWRDINQHFEREGQRMLQCHEVCNSQPWYLRGFCLQGCSGTPPGL
jgi:hypothetical protein